MKKKIFTPLLALLVAAGITLSAQAAALFPPTATYDNRFADVRPTDWFYSNVAALYSLGLTNGKGDNHHFEPASEITVAEVITMAARLRSLYDFGTSEAGADLFRGAGDAWYMPYVSYLRFVGIIGTEFDARMQFTATRAETAYLLANVLPADLFEEINADVVTEGYALGQFIQDINEYTPYQWEILKLYRWGILSGVDSRGTFRPDAPLSRSEMAAMFSRLCDSDLRIRLDWKITEENPILSLADLVSSDGTFFAAPPPDDLAAIDADIRYMLARGERTLQLDYGKPQSERQVRALMAAFLAGVRRYPEQTYNQINVTYSLVNGKITVEFSSNLYKKEYVELYRRTIFAEAVRVRDQLYSDGLLNKGMSEYQKAWVYFNWICNNCAYDFGCGDTDISHSAYGVFKNKRAVCDGYTAAYNLLLGLEGIECTSYDLEEKDHMWTVAVLDGVSYHIDATWGDQTYTVADRYFAMSEKDSLARFF